MRQLALFFLPAPVPRRLAGEYFGYAVLTVRVDGMDMLACPGGLAGARHGTKWNSFRNFPAFSAAVIEK